MFAAIAVRRRPRRWPAAGIDFQDVGYGSAASFLIFLVIALFTVIYVTAGRVSFAVQR